MHQSWTQRASFWCLGLFLGLLGPFQANAEIDLEAYHAFLTQNRDLSSDDLLDQYGRDRFAATAPANWAQTEYADSIDHYYHLTPYEKQQIERHSFVVTQRLQPSSFGRAYLDIYRQDLPLFVSSDAVLHALHRSYDAILADVEESLLWPHLDSLLTRMHQTLPALASRYSDTTALEPMLQDIDLYLTVPRRLLGHPAEPVFADNVSALENLLALTAAEQAAAAELFGLEAFMDFSQFTVRGHYDRYYWDGTPGQRVSLPSQEIGFLTPEQAADFVFFGRYFQAMMWLGRTPLNIDSPQGTLAEIDLQVLQRQSIDALLLDELVTLSGTGDLLAQMENLLAVLVGQPDNLTLAQLRQARTQMGLESPLQLLDEATFTAFQDQVRQQAAQHIVSQILFRDPLAQEPVTAAPAFLLIGQRFIIDSFITGNVVYDRTSTFRGLPSPLDVLFALGNNTAAQFLADDLQRYGYAPNLAALRYLIDHQSDEFWSGTLYNGWLQAIRTLSPPADRTRLPTFMRTAAWWQQKMNTQLAAWAQLRHDNLLYAKQSYTLSPVCQYPHTYIEPVPQFYQAIQTFAERAAQTFSSTPSLTTNKKDPLVNYFTELAAIADTLTGVAAKELSGTPMDAAETLFLKTVLFDVPAGCVPVFAGWYARLHYTGEDGFMEPDQVVADIHTQATDESGNFVGHILHVGTGPLDMAVVVADLPSCDQVAFIGPVMSFYQHTSLNFERLNDQQWQTAYAHAPSFRPDFSRIYLADLKGANPGPGRALATLVKKRNGPELVPTTPGLTASNYPNPFNSGTLIRFTVGPLAAHQPTRLTVYNMQGQPVRCLVESPLGAGHYSVRWDGRDETGTPVASGTYPFQLRAGQHQISGRLSLLR